MIKKLSLSAVVKSISKLKKLTFIVRYFIIERILETKKEKIFHS